MHPPLYDIRSEEMLNQFSRTELLLGKEAMERLENSSLHLQKFVMYHLAQ